MPDAKSSIIDGKIYKWTFGPETVADDFKAIYPELQSNLNTPEITRLMTVIDMPEPGQEELMQLWFNIGEAAQKAKIERWGVVAPPQDLMKKMSFEHMIKGAGAEREYEVKIGTAEDDILAWCKE